MRPSPAPLQVLSSIRSRALQPRAYGPRHVVREPRSLEAVGRGVDEAYVAHGSVELHNNGAAPSTRHASQGSAQRCTPSARRATWAPWQLVQLRCGESALTAAQGSPSPTQLDTQVN